MSDARRPASPPFTSAKDAYEHAVHVNDPEGHRLDVTEKPRWPAQPPVPTTPATRADPPPREAVVRHRVDSPVRLGFGFGFGFAAGQGLFRLAVAVIGVGLVVAIVWQVLSSALH
jgi:hypothetical protein